jgi:hypothetical protein
VPFPFSPVIAILAAVPQGDLITGGVQLTFGGLAIYVIQRLWKMVDDLLRDNREMTAQLTLSTAVLNEVKELLR